MISKKRAGQLIDIAEVMEEFGISSPLTLKFFTMVVARNGATLLEIVEAREGMSEQEVKRYYGAFRRLAGGEHGPGSGSGLIKNGKERNSYNEKSYFLTEKGRKCAEKLGLIK